MRKPRICRLLSVAIVSCLALSRFAAADWETYQGNPAHTGYVPGSLELNSYGIKWKANFGYAGYLGLAIGGDTVLVKHAIYDAVAFDQSTGAKLWTSNAASAPAYANGAFYMQHYGGFSAFAARTGAEIFTAQYDDQGQDYLNPTPYQGNIYMGGGRYGGLFSFDATNGNQNWFAAVAQYDRWTPAIDENYCYTFTGSGTISPVRGHFRIINRHTGQTESLITDNNYMWTGYEMRSSVVLGSHANAFSINAADLSGRLISWDLRSDATHTPHIAWVRTDNYKFQPTLANGVLYVNNGYKLNALDELSGQTLWTWSPPPDFGLYSTMIATDNLLFVTTVSNIYDDSIKTYLSATYALDLSTHQPVWSFPAGGEIALSDGTLYIAGINGNVYAIGVPEPSVIGLLAIAGLCFHAVHRLARGCWPQS